MTKFGQFLVASAVMVAPIGLASPASATTLVNGDFETGDFTGWTQFGNTGFSTVDTVNPFAGTFAASFGPVGSTGGITQTLSTVIGNVYTLSFYLANGTAFGPAIAGSSFSATVGSTTFSLPSDFFAFDYAPTPFTVIYTADSTSTAVTFTFRNDPNFWYLDNVTIAETAAVPEPASWAMMVAGFGLIGGAARRRRKVSTSVTFA